MPRIKLSFPNGILHRSGRMKAGLLTSLWFGLALLSACGTFEMGVLPGTTSPPTENGAGFVGERGLSTQTSTPAPFGSMLSPITRENADRIGMLALLGSGVVWEAAPSPDGSTLAVASSAGVWLYELDSMVTRRLLEGHDGEVFAVSWSPDSARIASVGGDNTLSIWDARSGELLHTLEDELGTDDVRWSPDGAILATKTSNGMIRLWDATTLGLIQTLEWVPDCLRAKISWLSGGERLGLTCRKPNGGGSIMVLERGTWQPVDAALELTSVSALAWDPGGEQIAAAGRDEFIRVWEVFNPGKGKIYRSQNGVPRSLAWSPDGSRLAWGSDGGLVEVWQFEAGQDSSTLVTGMESAPRVVWASDSRRLITTPSGFIGHVQVWDVVSGIELGNADHTFWVREMAWSPEGSQLAACSMDGSVYFWKPGEEMPIAFHETIERVSPDGCSISWAPDGTQFVTAGIDGVLRLWDVQSGQQVRVMDQRGPVLGLAWDLYSDQLASWGPDSVLIWEPATGLELSALVVDLPITNVSWSPDGDWLAVGTGDKGVSVWIPGEMNPVNELESGVATGVAWSQDGSRLATASDEGLHVWEIPSGKLLWATDVRNLHTIAWSPDGSKLTGGTDFGKVLIWSTERWERIHSLDAGSSVLALVWSPNGSLLASGSNRITIWDAGSGRKLVELSGNAGLVEGLTWSPEGDMLASTGTDRAIRVWVVR